jgi:deoxycytidylate deaminase
MNDQQTMKILSKIAESVDPFPNVRLASALVYKNEILSIGTNKNKSHPFQKKYAPNVEAIFLHAETDAIYNAMRRYNTEMLSKSKLYVYRAKWVNDQRDHFIQGLAKPCSGCQRAIANFNIKHVCYTLDIEGFDYL